MLTTNPKMPSLWWSSQIKIISNISRCLTFLLLQKITVFHITCFLWGKQVAISYHILWYLSWYISYTELKYYIILVFLYGVLQYEISKHQQPIIQVCQYRLDLLYLDAGTEKKKSSLFLTLFWQSIFFVEAADHFLLS